MRSLLRFAAPRAAAAWLLGAAALLSPGVFFAINEEKALAQVKPPPSVVADGKPIGADLLQRDGRLYIRAAHFRRLGASVKWIEATQSVRLAKNGRTVDLAAKDGVVHRPEGSYVPLRLAAESLGMSVQYDEASNAAHVRTAAAPQRAAAKTFAVTAEERYWLEQITEAEAGGETYEGKVAVAATVLNRVEHEDWPDSVIGVIFQVVEVGGVKYYQFSPVLDGRIYAVKPTAETARAVEAALNGEDPTDGAVVFYNPEKTGNVWVRSRPVVKTIGGHVFAK